MKKIILGGLAVLIGVAGASKFFFSIIGVLLGALPILLILGGALAFYLGFTEIQENKKQIPVSEPEIPRGPGHKETGQEPSVTMDTTAPVQENPETPTPKTDTPLFKGNAETLVFHRITCNFSQGKKCTAEFATREEAVEQGYKPCKVCSP